MWMVVEPCWNQPCTYYSSVNFRQNCLRITCTYLLQVTASLKGKGLTIRLPFTPHKTLNLTGWSGTLWVRYGFHELQ
jgi:hypothetical protein